MLNVFLVTQTIFGAVDETEGMRRRRAQIVGATFSTDYVCDGVESRLRLVEYSKPTVASHSLASSDLFTSKGENAHAGRQAS